MRSGCREAIVVRVSDANSESTLKVIVVYLLRHTIERLVGGNFELYFVRVALARQTLKHTSDGVTVELTSTRHRQSQIKHL